MENLKIVCFIEDVKQTKAYVVIKNSLSWTSVIKNTMTHGIIFEVEDGYLAYPPHKITGFSIIPTDDICFNDYGIWMKYEGEVSNKTKNGTD